MSPCFVGITDLFGSGDSVGRGPCGSHSVSVVAATHGYAFSCCLLCFTSFVDRVSSNSGLANAFRFLSQSQMATWTTPTRAEEETRAVDTKHALNEQTIEDVGINDETVPSRVSINQLSTPTEMPKIPEEDAPNINSVEGDNANHINLNDNFTKGK